MQHVTLPACQLSLLTGVCKVLQEAVLLCEDVCRHLLAAQPGWQRRVAEGDTVGQGVRCCSGCLTLLHAETSASTRSAQACLHVCACAESQRGPVHPCQIQAQHANCRRAIPRHAAPSAEPSAEFWQHQTSHVVSRKKRLPFCHRPHALSGSLVRPYLQDVQRLCTSPAPLGPLQVSEVRQQVLHGIFSWPDVGGAACV